MNQSRINRPWARPLAAGGIAIALGAVLARLVGDPAMPSYLAAWLFGTGVPLGALAMLLILGIGGGSVATQARPALCKLTRAMPLAGVLFVPVLFAIPALYPWAHGSGPGDMPGAPFGDALMRPDYFVARSIVYLVLFALLGLLFARRPDRSVRHRAGALLGLFVLVLAATLAGIDWIMSLTPSLHSGEFGLLILGMQCATATAILVPALPREAARGGAWLLAATAAAWLYLHFMHYLVIWSGDLPREASWYLTRDAAAGRTVEWLVFIGGFVLPIGLLALPMAMRAGALPIVAMLALLAHMLEALWFVTPSFRGHFALRAPDVLMLAGCAGLLLALLRAAPRLPAPSGAGRLQEQAS